MKTHVFSIENTQFVAGLFWQPLAESANSEKQKEIKALAKQLEFELYVLRNTQNDCVGFANPSEEVKHGQASSAAIVSKTMGEEFDAQDFIFVTQLPDDKWIYVAQRDGLILPDGDVIFDSEDAARSRLLEDTSIGDWSYVIAPAIWGIKKSTERTFDSMLPRNKKNKLEVHKWWRLTNVDSNKELARHKGKFIIGLLLIAAAFGGLKFYKEYKLKKDMEAALALQQQMDAQNKPIVIEHPWKTIPVASDVWEGCMSALSGVQLFPGNWTLTAANCANGMLTVTWKPQAKGWIEHLRAVHPQAVISLDGSMASISIPLATMQSGYDETVSQENLRLIEMYSAAQRYGFKFTVAPAATPAPALPGQEVANAAPPKDWKDINWKAEGITLPEIVLAGLDGDGFRMNSMNATWQNGKFTWTMEGTQYVKP